MTIPSEILAAIIGALVTGLLALGVYLYKSHKGNKVILEKVKESSLIELRKDFSNNIEIKLKGYSVEKLILYEFELYNSSDNNITDLLVNIEFQCKESNFLVSQITKDVQKITIADETFSENSTKILEIKRPYLKPRKKYKKEVISIQIISNSNINFSITGGGENWNADYGTEFRKALEFLIFGALSIFMAIALIIYYAYSLLTFGTDNSYLIIFASVFTIICIFFLWYADRKTKV